MSQFSLRRRALSAAVVTAFAALAAPAIAAGFKPAPAQGTLGGVITNPYGNAPLTAVIDRLGKPISDVFVTVHGKGAKGVSISYPVGPKTLLTNDGIPVFGLYQKHANQVTVEYSLNGKKYKDKYTIRTGAIENRYIDNRNTSDLQEVKVHKVAQGFEDRLYLVNSHTITGQGSELHWAGQKGKDAGILDANPAAGALTFDVAPMTYVVDTQGEYRWWLNQDMVYDGFGKDVDRRGYLMGLHLTQRGTYTFVQGQKWYEMDLMGKLLASYKLPRGYQDLTHASFEMPNGNVLLRAGKTNYVKEDGFQVHSIRDQILEVNRAGQLVDVWSLPEILDPLRDSLLGSLDMGAVCVNVDMDNAGKKAKLEPNTPYGDALGVGAGRNWAHVNSIAYDPKDDSIILSSRHQGVVKIGRDKQVKWILAPREGWNAKLAPKVLKPVDRNGKPISCSEKGLCENSDFDWVYTQHTAWLSSKGTLTVFDNGDGRHLDQPAMPTMKYSRFVEYKIDEKAGTVQQLWEYGKERGYDWYSPITSITEYRADRDTMFGFGGSIHLFEPGKPVIGKINEIDYKTKEVKVEIDVFSDKVNIPHYRALVVTPKLNFGR